MFDRALKDTSSHGMKQEFSVECSGHQSALDLQKAAMAILSDKERFPHQTTLEARCSLEIAERWLANCRACDHRGQLADCANNRRVA